METLNSMEKLNLLEKKFTTLIEKLKSEKELSAKLTLENQELSLKISQMENMLLKGTQDIEEMSQERALTKMVVDELICNIDKLVEQEQQ